MSITSLPHRQAKAMERKMAEFSGELVGVIAIDCGISENEVVKRLVEVAGRRPGTSPNQPLKMSAWGQKWASTHLSHITGIPARTLRDRWANGVRYPHLVKRTAAIVAGPRMADACREQRRDEEKVLRDAEACDKLLQRLRKFHPELETAGRSQADCEHTASGVINGSRFRDAAFAGVRSAGHMEAI